MILDVGSFPPVSREIQANFCLDAMFLRDVIEESISGIIRQANQGFLGIE